ncbi:hypothetical protein JZ751_000199 [Albula glossodonta]|uniref:Regulator of G protein signalling-like domain-containing protein n=1 Tax=Albula glossodonta TaxID=121402 RepID=A0A8T2PVK6_9TELE|nr:hypothetical protein JZ751_000199 [Albula glossodonta]
MDSEEAHDGSELFGALCSNPAMSIIGAEDDFFENDLDTTVDDQCSHFNSIDLLKDRPTHLLVFLHHVMLQFDTAPVLCYLHAELFKSLSAKETKKQFVDFHNTFIDKGASFGYLCQQAGTAGMLSQHFTHEDLQKRYATDIQGLLIPEINRQLEDFKQKRMMGMTPNEHELMEVESHHSTDRIPTEMKEKAVAENLLEKLAENQQTLKGDGTVEWHPPFSASSLAWQRPHTQLVRGSGRERDGVSTATLAERRGVSSMAPIQCGGLTGHLKCALSTVREREG